MKEGIIIIAITELIEKLGYKGISIDEINSDIFSNQLILRVSGDCERYPEIKPLQRPKSVTGL